MDASGRVLFVGTFSKVMFPALRLGYVVVPEERIEAARRARVLADFACPDLSQVTMAAFMLEGHFDRHVRRMRTLYQRRHTLLVEALRQRFGGTIEVAPSSAGMNLVVWLPPQLDDRTIADRAQQAGLDLFPLSAVTVAHRRRPGLLLGFGGINDQEILEGVEKLAGLIDP